MVNRIECLLAAVGKLNGAYNPDSECFAINNPLMVRSFGKPGKHFITDSGVRIFSSILSGTKACLYDLELKIQGRSRAGLASTSTLTHLLGCYNLKEKNAIDNVVAFLRRGLKDQTITANTSLAYFIEKPEEKKDTE